MRVSTASLVLVCALAGTGRPEDRGAASPDPVPEETPLAPSQVEIDDAVARGVAWLRQEQKRDGSFGQGPGETALALLTLRHSGVAADDRACRRAAMALERDLPDGTVYGAALGVIALLEQDARLHESKVAALLEDVVSAQCANGQWSYGYRRSQVEAAGDNSNSQFAVLALAAARARRIDVPTETFARAREFLVRTQNDDGGFGYSEKERSRSYASMTAGAAMTLALATAIAQDIPFGARPVRDDAAVRRTLDWLAENFDPETNAGAAQSFGKRKGRRSDAFWRHYWLWSLERAAAAAGTEAIGEHRWYAAGCRVLLERQHDDGQWRDPEKELLATCFALLFFRRSTERVITPRDRVAPTVTPSGANAPADEPRPPDAK